MAMEVRTCRNAIAAALLVALAGCDGDDDGTRTPSSGAPVSTPADAFADLDRLIADADAYRFVADILREDAGFSREGEPFDGSFITDVFAGFERATDGNGDTATLLAEKRTALQELTAVGCEINGEYDGVGFADTPDGEDSDGEFGEFVSAGEALPLSDETRALGVLLPDTADDETGPFYEWDMPDELDRTTIGVLSVEVPGDVFPGLGTLTVPATPLAGLVVDAPQTVESVVRWEPLGDGGTITIGMDVDGDGDDFVGISCVTDDDGEFRVPDATLARLPGAVDGPADYFVERQRTGIAPLGEAIVLSTGRTIRILSANE